MEFELKKKTEAGKDKVTSIIDVIYEDEIANYTKELEGYSLSKELKKRILDKLKPQKETKKNEPYRVHSFQQENGGYISILVFKKNIKNFDIQVAIRKGLLTVVKDSEYIELNIKLISEQQQRYFIDFYASFCKLQSWKSPVYGKKAKENLGEKKKDVKKKTVVEAVIKDSDFKEIISRGIFLGEANNLVRTLAVMPSNILNPEKYQSILQERAQKGKYIYRFFGQDSLKKMGAGAFLAVLSSDENTKGGIAHLSYKPKNKSKGKICLVGKGVCFDTGGNNIKTGGYMYTMHRDMTGSAVALALFETLIRLGVPYELHGVLAIAENYVSPTGYKPNDVVVTMNGTSIEVVDTDAEGRMILSDSLCYASDLKPDVIIDFATLTGSAVRSIGTARSAIFSNNKKLLKDAMEASELSGERAWAFPIGEDYRDQLKSEVADIKQCLNKACPDHILASTFLSEFVAEGIPWLHVDLSSEENDGGLGLVDTDVTGFGVRYGLSVLQLFLDKDK